MYDFRVSERSGAGAGDPVPAVPTAGEQGGPGQCRQYCLPSGLTAETQETAEEAAGPGKG